jgi:hypothetical protein
MCHRTGTGLPLVPAAPLASSVSSSGAAMATIPAPQLGWLASLYPTAAGSTGSRSSSPHRSPLHPGVQAQPPPLASLRHPPLRLQSIGLRHGSCRRPENALLDGCGNQFRVTCPKHLPGVITQ